MASSSDEATSRESNIVLVLRGTLRVIAFVALCAAGGLNGYWNAWLLLGLTLVILTVNLLVLLWRNPVLLRERLKPDRPTQSWDKKFMIVSGVLGIAIVVVAPLDHFVLHGPQVPLWGVLVGIALFLVGNAIVAWAMSENPFLERTVRIQEDRNQRVITTGPYAFVRHPMYTGMLVMVLGWPLILGSWWALLPSLLFDVSLLVRTRYEDRMLHDDLPGYREYAQKTRNRLLPGW